MTSSRAAASFKRWQVRQTVEALKANSEAVRSICDIREWVQTQEHLISRCATENCIACEARQSLLDSLAALLPSMPDPSGHTGGGR